MRYFIAVGGCKSGTQKVSIDLAYNLNLANGAGTAAAMGWGEWVKWRPETEYDLTKFSERLATFAENNPSVQDLVIYGPGVVKHFVTSPSEEASALFPGAQFFWVKRSDRTVEQNQATRLFNRGNNNHKVARMKQDSERLSAMETAWTSLQSDFYTNFDTLVASKTFEPFSGFAVNSGAISLAVPGPEAVTNIVIAS